MERTRNDRSMRAWRVFICFCMVVFDIFAVNFSYFGALLVRFYVASVFNTWAVIYVPAFQKFAPYYTVCCLIVFYFFKLYRIRWKYASLNDLNRILIACLVTCVIQVLGSLIFVMRMPITYYFFGAFFQFCLIALSRFSYRFFLYEQKSVRRLNRNAINVMVVGVGETARMALKHLERDGETAVQPVCMFDYQENELGNMLDGVPIITGLDKIKPALEKYKVGSVIFADALIPQEVKERIRDICMDTEITVQEFFSYVQDFRGTVYLRGLLECAKGPVELLINGTNTGFYSGEEAIASLSDRYLVNSVSAHDDKLLIELKSEVLVPNDMKEEWVQNYKQDTGSDISFF